MNFRRKVTANRRKVCNQTFIKPTPHKFILKVFRIFYNSQNLKEITLKSIIIETALLPPIFRHSCTHTLITQQSNTLFLAKMFLGNLFCSVVYQGAGNPIVSPLRRHMVLAHCHMLSCERVLYSAQCKIFI